MNPKNAIPLSARSRVVANALRPAAFAFLSVIALALAFPFLARAQTALPSTNTKAVATFESLGLSWTPPSNPGTAGCSVRYQKVGELTWKTGLPMWYDARNRECRGSLVHLAPGTQYVVQFSLPGQSPSAQLTATTWSENFPIARTVTLPATSAQTYAITSGGSATGYVLYTAPSGGTSTIDVANTKTYNITISAPYVIVRGLTLKGAQRDAIRLLPGAHDVVIEKNDISAWGSFRITNAEGDMGTDNDSAVRAVCTDMSLERIVVQRNRIHDPRYTTNSWSLDHPYGATGIHFEKCGGNHVFRYNDIRAGISGHYYKDGIGGSENFTTTGFPVADTDIYGNIIMNTWDDGIEVEGGNRNVRVWGNYLDQVMIGVASTPVATGPLYIFRNVENRSRQLKARTLDNDQRQPFAKAGTQSSTIGGGRRYLFHNTLLQATQSGVINGLGAGGGIGNAGRTIDNTMSRNNIFHVWKASAPTYYGVGVNNDFGFDLYNGSLGATVINAIKGTPIYATGNGWQNEAGGMYQLASNSPGYDKGARLPNFNDSFLGAAPDIGAAEAGGAKMQFGVNAYATTTAAPAPAPTPSPTPAPTTSLSTPYTGTPIAIPGRFEAENFDKGGEGVAYHDNVKGNVGGVYRTTEDVDLIVSNDSAGGGYIVNNFQTGEWLNYTISVATSGNYSVQLRGSNNYSSSAAFHVEVDGAKVTGSQPFPMTGNWSTYQWVATPVFALSAGKHVLKVFNDQQYFNLNSVNVVSAPTTTTPLPTTGADWSCDFEGSYCEFFEQSKLGGISPTSTSQRRSSLVPIARSGKLGVRLHTESGDNNVNGSGTWERNDLGLGRSAAYCNQGQEEWWAHSVLFPDDYVFPPSGSGIVMDFHHSGSTGQSNFELQTIPGTGLRFKGHGGPVVSGGEYVAVVPDPYGAPKGSVMKNVWYDFVYHVKWNSGSTGLMEAWLNGKKVLTYNGPTLYTGQTCYLKLANYHSAFGKASSVIHDRVIRGKSASAVTSTPLQQ